MQTILFFDIDSTLVENHFSYQIVERLMQPVMASSGKSASEIGEELFWENRRRQRENPNDLLTMDWDDIVETVAAGYGVTLEQPLIDLWQQNSTPALIELLDQADDVLRQLKQPHRKLVIATKGLSKYQMPVLQAVGIDDLFDDYLTPDITGHLKTEPGFFNGYQQHAAHTRLIQIGDHYYDDVICARRNGFISVMRAPIEALRYYDAFERPEHLLAHRKSISTYPYEGTDILPDAVILSLQELPDIIERFEAE